MLLLMCVDINVDVIEVSTKIFNINNTYDVYCKLKCITCCQSKCSYVMTYMTCCDILLHDIRMTYVEIFISWHPYSIYELCSMKC